jgi:F0F1-type ATP synthase assembly protein I
MADQRPPRTQRGPSVVTLLSIGSLCGVLVGLGVFLGVLVDGAVGTSPLFALVGLVLGIVGAAFASYQVIRPYVKG